MSDPPIPLVKSAALVDGLAAAMLGTLANDAWRQGRFDHIPADDRRTIAAVIVALTMAADEWRASVAGSAETPTVAAPIRSHEMDTFEASRLLQISERHVRNLAFELGGRQVGGRWLFDGDTVRAEAERRRAAHD